MTLARLLQGHRDTVRADVLRFYGADADEYELSMLWEFILSMPRGSRTLALVDPATRWTDEGYLLASLIDMVGAIGAGLGGSKPPKPIPRPGDAARKERSDAEARSRAASIRRRILSAEWKEVENGG